MRPSLMCVLALAALASSAHAQEAPSSTSDRSGQIEVKIDHPAQLDDADRAEIRKGTKLVASGAQGFFQALNDALNQIHRERAEQAKRADAQPNTASDASAEEKKPATTP